MAKEFSGKNKSAKKSKKTNKLHSRRIAKKLKSYRAKKK
jgi:hypothetical protein